MACLPQSSLSGFSPSCCLSPWSGTLSALVSAQSLTVHLAGTPRASSLPLLESASPSPYSSPGPGSWADPQGLESRGRPLGSEAHHLPNRALPTLQQDSQEGDGGQEGHFVFHGAGSSVRPRRRTSCRALLSPCAAQRLAPEKSGPFSPPLFSVGVWGRGMSTAREHQEPGQAKGAETRARWSRSRTQHLAAESPATSSQSLLPCLCPALDWQSPGAPPSTFQPLC